MSVLAASREEPRVGPSSGSAMASAFMLNPVANISGSSSSVPGSSFASRPRAATPVVGRLVLPRDVELAAGDVHRNAFYTLRSTAVSPLASSPAGRTDEPADAFDRPTSGRRAGPYETRTTQRSSLVDAERGAGDDGDAVLADEPLDQVHRRQRRVATREEEVERSVRRRAPRRVAERRSCSSTTSRTARSRRGAVGSTPRPASSAPSARRTAKRPAGRSARVLDLRTASNRCAGITMLADAPAREAVGLGQRVEADRVRARRRRSSRGEKCAAPSQVKYSYASS